MKKELRTVVYDEDLHIEAYRFEGFVRPFWTGWKRLMEPGSCQSSPPVLSSTRKLLPACVLSTSWS